MAFDGNKFYSDILSSLASAGNLRAIPDDCRGGDIIDFSSNDYLGLNTLTLVDFIDEHPNLLRTPVTSSASRLLASSQNEYAMLEADLEALYPDRKALIFNSGYHANTGVISALANRSSIILADRLVHASIIDGVQLSRARMLRFAHNDLADLRRLLEANYAPGKMIWIVAESVYSMDGDFADIDALIDLKQDFPGVMLYVDEAHAFGVEGPQGRGLVAASKNPLMVDVTVATFGKALASYGAFAIVSAPLRQYLLNKARSFIFSTSLPPLQIEWTRLMIKRMLVSDDRRSHLRELARRFNRILTDVNDSFSVVSHIQPLMVGDAAKAVEISRRLRQHNMLVLPIRTPTVPAGTERLRFSLSANLSLDNLALLENVLKQCVEN